MVNKFKLTNSKRVATPMESGAQFSREQGPSTPNQAMHMRGVPYAEAIGSVLWPVVVSRPDAAYAVGVSHSSYRTLDRHTGKHLSVLSCISDAQKIYGSPLEDVPQP